MVPQGMIVMGPYAVGSRMADVATVAQSLDEKELMEM